MTRPVPKWRVIGLNPLGTILSLVGVSAALLFPWVLYKSNRVLPGVPRDLIDVLPGADVMIGTVLMVGVAAIATFCSGARLRLAAALLGLAVVAFTLAAASDALTPQGNRVVRIAPGAGFWTLLMCLILLAADAAARWRPGPAWRMLLLAGVTAVVVVGFAYGTFDHVSIMREYTINADRFRREFRQHVWLAIGRPWTRKTPRMK